MKTDKKNVVLRIIKNEFTTGKQIFLLPAVLYVLIYECLFQQNMYHNVFIILGNVLKCILDQWDSEELQGGQMTCDS